MTRDQLARRIRAKFLEPGQGCSWKELDPFHKKAYYNLADWLLLKLGQIADITEDDPVTVPDEKTFGEKYGKFAGAVDGPVMNTPGTIPTTAPQLAPGKRACSICRQPGHRATTCKQRKKT